MSNKNGIFTFDWKIGIVRDLFNRRGAYDRSSPIFKANTVKGTKWYLRVLRVKSAIPGSFTCFLYRYFGDDSSENESLTFKLELIDEDGKIMKSVLKENITFSASCHEVANFLNNKSLELYWYENDYFFNLSPVILRCHILDESCNKQIMIQEISTLIHTQWKIIAPGDENWSKKIKVPFHECTHLDIIMSASQERINIEIEHVDLLQLYELKVAVLTEENRKIDCKMSRKADESQKFETWIEKTQIVDESRFHLPYSFTLICSIATSCGDSDPSNDSIPSLVSSCLPLQEDLKKMLLDDKHSDVKLRSHDKLIAAHKCLLSARSPVFSTMFDQDMLETQTGVVDIPDVESETLQSFLEFLYTDMIVNTDSEEILKLMLVADKYQVDNLRERCYKILIAKLSVENICNVISVAEMVNHPELKLSAIEFVRANKKKILSSSIWAEWMKGNMELANEILMNMIVD